MSESAKVATPPLDPEKFQDRNLTAAGEPRAEVAMQELRTLWFNTGTLCNLTCTNCYIESSPTNDRLVYLTAAEVAGYLDEIARDRLATREVGFTGGEPFMNPDLVAMLEDVLGRGFKALVLTNAMRPMMKCADALLDLQDRYGDDLVIRVSVDHYTELLHQLERGPRSWQPTIDGLTWLSRNGFHLRVAGRMLWNESEADMRKGFGRLFAAHKIRIDASDPVGLLLLPEMDETIDVPEITERCWGILDVDPDDMMCATSRMVVKHKGQDHPAVMPCTLLPYDQNFQLGRTLADSFGPVKLNHPHCSRFCVLGGGTCSNAD